MLTRNNTPEKFAVCCITPTYKNVTPTDINPGYLHLPYEHPISNGNKRLILSKYL